MVWVHFERDHGLLAHQAPMTKKTFAVRMIARKVVTGRGLFHA
jgi:hypothetical protein